MTINAQGKDSCQPCHRLCKRCHGPTRNDCDECRTDTVPFLRPLQGKSCKCIDGTFDDDQQVLPSQYCQPCHEFCTKCDGARDLCSECIDSTGIMHNGIKCVCNRPGYFVYFNTTLNQEQCVKCHPLCAKCTGPSNTQCSDCDTSRGGVYSEPKTCDCVPHSYYDKAEGYCVPCDALCGNCIGPGPRECTSCDPYNAYSVIDKPTWCITSCAELDGYFRYLRICSSIFFNKLKFQ